MADSFADLWNASAPSKPAPPPQKLGSISSTLSSSSRRPQNDVFALLSATSSASSSRPLTPSTAAASPPQRPPQKGPASGDAFSGLLAGTLGTNGTGAPLTIAERAAQAERDRREGALRRHQAAAARVQTQSSAWDGLDTLAAARPTPTSTASSGPPEEEEDWGLGLGSALRGGVQNGGRASASPVVSAPSRVDRDQDDWGLGDFAAKPSSMSTATSPAPPPRQAIWDLDDFASPSPAPPAHASSAEPLGSPPLIREPTPHADPLADFDFGNREDRLLNDDGDEHDEDDILGILSKPVDALPKRGSPFVRPLCPSSPL